MYVSLSIYTYVYIDILSTDSLQNSFKGEFQDARQHPAWVDTLQRGVQWIRGAVDWGSIT